MPDAKLATKWDERALFAFGLVKQPGRVINVGAIDPHAPKKGLAK